MSTSTILPLEGMNGIGGWAFYILGAGLLILANAFVGYWAARFWFSFARLYLDARQRGGRTLIRARETMVGVTMLFVLGILMWVFVRMAAIQIVQFVRFDAQEIVLVYRWPWLDQTISYHSIRNVQIVDDPPVMAISGTPPKQRFPVKIVITTLDHIYYIDSGSSELRNKARAIYDEIRRHSADFAPDSAFNKGH